MKQTRTILMATMGLEIGGAETHIVELSKELRRRGYDIIVVSKGGVYEQELTQNEIASELGVSRPLVSRMLREARRLGIVEIRINDPEQGKPLLEMAMRLE